MATVNAQKVQLIVEKSNGELWGRVKVKGNLIIDTAKTTEGLKTKLKKLVYELEDVDVKDFEVSYDLTSFFEQYSFINITDFAKKAGINPTLMRQYVSGNKYPSQERVREIEMAAKEIGRQLMKIKLHKPDKELA